MTSAATEFLTKQLSIEKEIVTFRWLSRALSIHVNIAKNELASFHASSRVTAEPVHATFLLMGEVPPIEVKGSYRDNDEMDVDDNETEMVPTTKTVLVGEDELEAAKTQFTRLSSVHVYSLSPSVIKDATLLFSTADRVRLDDISKGKAHSQVLGVVVGPDVKVGRLPKSNVSNATKAIATTSKLKPAADAQVAEKPRSSDKAQAPEKSKVDEKKRGTLDWSKAKTKTDKEKEAATLKKEKEMTKKEKQVVKKESKATLKEKGEGSSKTTMKKDVAAEKPKRGTKRPSAVMSLSDSEDEESKDDNPGPKTRPRTSTSAPSKPPSKTEKAVKVKKGVLISDDEDETKDMTSKSGRQKGKRRALVSDDEEDTDCSIRAMMDLDDSQVIRHNQAPAVPECGLDEEDVEMLSDSEPVHVRPKAKRKPKKVIPTGSNGLPKKRVVKSRKAKNAKGYLVTGDYSSYESVSESEQANLPPKNEKKPKKGNRKVQKEDDVAVPEKPGSQKPTSAKSAGTGDDSSFEQSKAKEEKTETKKPGSGSGGSPKSAVVKGGKNNLMNYFGKK